MSVRLRLLGDPMLRRQDGSEQSFGTGLTDALAVVLALRDGPTPRETLAAMLWPDRPDDKARANLRWRLYRLRDRPELADLQADRGTVAWPVASDVRDLRYAAKRGDDATVVSLGATPLLGRHRFDLAEPADAFLEDARREIARLGRAAALRLAASRSEDGDHAAAAEILAAWCDHEPWDEELLQAYLQAAFLAGQRTEPLQRYESFAAALKREMDLEPLAQTKRLVADIREADAFLAAVPGSSDAASAPVDDGLPSFDTPFLARDRELASIEEWLLAGQERTLTLVGPGGIGKSRLAVQALRSLQGRLPGSVRFVDVGDAREAVDVARALLRAWSGAPPGPDPLAQAAHQLSGLQGVTVLDRYEAWVGRDAALRPLLDAARGMRFLATSRVHDPTPGRRALALAGLSTTGDDGAVRLFDALAERASGPQRQGPREREAVHEIVRTLDGVPLAIELAAAWTRTLSVHEILEALRRDDRVVLTRASDDRHADLEAVFEAAWERLPEPACMAAEALSVFRGGVPAGAAAAVANASPTCLASLTAGAVLHRSQDRYRMLEPLRRFAERRLAASGRARRVRDAHAAWYGRFVTDTLQAGRARRETVPARALLVELEDLRAAWIHVLDVRDPDGIQQLGPGISETWDLAGRAKEGRELFETAVAVLRDGVDGLGNATLGLSLTRAAWFAFQLGAYDRAAREAAEAEAGLSEADCGSASGTAAYVRAVAAAAIGREAEARAAFQHAAARFEAAGDRAGVARCQSGLGQLEHAAGRYPQARQLLSRSLDERAAIGDVRGMVATAVAMAATLRALGDAEAAAQEARRALSLAREAGDAWGEGMALHEHAVAMAAAGENGRAEQALRRATDLLDRSGQRYAATLPREALGALLLRARPDAALSPWSQALRSALDLGASPRVAALLSRCLEARAERAPEQAVAWAQALLRAGGVPWEARDRAERTVARCRLRMEPERYAAAALRGTRTSLQDAAEAAWQWARIAGGSAAPFVPVP